MTVSIGPVELLALTFPGDRADPRVIEILAEVVSRGYVTVLDVVFLDRTPAGLLQVTDVDEDLDDVGLGFLDTRPQALISEDDLGVIRDALEPGTSAAVIVYEHTWSRRLASAVEGAGGAVALHVRVPPDTVIAAVNAAS